MRRFGFTFWFIHSDVCSLVWDVLYWFGRAATWMRPRFGARLFVRRIFPTPTPTTDAAHACLTPFAIQFHAAYNAHCSLCRYLTFLHMVCIPIPLTPLPLPCAHCGVCCGVRMRRPRFHGSLYAAAARGARHHAYFCRARLTAAPALHRFPSLPHTRPHRSPITTRPSPTLLPVRCLPLPPAFWFCPCAHVCWFNNAVTCNQ